MSAPGHIVTGRSGLLLAVNLKTYLDAAMSRRWCLAVRDIAIASPAVTQGRVSLAVMPAMALLPSAVAWFEGSPVVVGAQDVSTASLGPHTGETPARLLAEIGCRLALVGHAEKRRGGDTDAVVAQKVRRAFEAGLTPFVCVGEQTPSDPGVAAAWVVEQLRRSLADSPAGDLMVAYEPVWAIGAAEPAARELIMTVCASIADWLSKDTGRSGSLVLYGGSAGPGLLELLGDVVNGLFLGRSVHDPEVLETIVRDLDQRT